jgi:phage protein U
MAQSPNKQRVSQGEPETLAGHLSPDNEGQAKQIEALEQQKC